MGRRRRRSAWRQRYAQRSRTWQHLSSSSRRRGETHRVGERLARELTVSLARNNNSNSINAQGDAVDTLEATATISDRVLLETGDTTSASSSASSSSTTTATAATTAAALLAQATQHYGRLFGAPEPPEHHQEASDRQTYRGVLLDTASARRLTAHQAASCEGQLTFGELSRALHKIRSGRAPGPDGLPIELYRALWPELGEELLAVFNDGLECGELPVDTQRGAVTLLYKRKGNVRELDNWRPLTMLNVDHKLSSRAASRHDWRRCFRW